MSPPSSSRPAERYRNFDGLGRLVSTVVVPLVALLGLALAWRRIAPRVRARNHVEGALLVFIIASSTVAILTTAGIVLSVLFEAFRFFQRACPSSTSPSESNGARRPRFAPTRWVRRGRSA